MTATIKKLEESPSFKRLANEALQRDEVEQQQARAEAAVELEKIEAIYQAERRRLLEKRDAAHAHIRELQDDLAVAQKHAREISADMLRLDGDHHGRQQRPLRTMRRTMSPAWGEFLGELSQLESETRKALRVRPRQSSFFAFMLGRPTQAKESNSAAVSARLKAIVDARSKIEQIKAEFVGDFGEKIAELRASIPSESTLNAFLETRESSLLRGWLTFSNNNA